MRLNGLMLLCAMCLCAVPRSAAAQNPPFTQCPPVGLDTSCRLLITVDAQGSLRLQTDPNVSAYDGIDDTLVGVVNNHPTMSIASIPLHGSGAIFAFDGDGVCDVTPQQAGCPFGTTHYEGPGVTFSSISTDLQSGLVNFNPPIPPGGTAYFGLEVAIQTLCPPVSVPLVTQEMLPWGPHQYADIVINGLPGTIKQYGAFLTSWVMLINYHAANQGNAFQTDPDLLNDYLNTHSGYVSGQIVPQQVQAYAISHGIRFAYQNHYPGRNDLTVESYLCTGNPPILDVAGLSAVVATGQTTVDGIPTYSINDPGPNGYTTLAPFNYSYDGEWLADEGVPHPWITLIIHSPVELLVTDSSGRQTGTNPFTGSSLQEIPASSYSEESVGDSTGVGPATPTIKVLEISSPGVGSYSIQTIGTGSGAYTLEIRSDDGVGNSSIKTVSGQVIAGSVANHTVNFDGSSQSTVTSFCGGDVNQDGVVNFLDLIEVLESFGRRQGEPGFDPAADVNNDGIVNLRDLEFVARDLGCRTSTQ